MKVACVLLFALFSLGFIVDSPESRREQERQHQIWRKQFKRAYDLPALRAFLAEQVEATGQIEGVDLSKSRVADRWSLGGGIAQCGDWLFVGKIGEAEFALRWVYADIPHSDGSGGIWKIVQFHCARDGKGVFRRLSATKTEDEYVILMP